MSEKTMASLVKAFFALVAWAGFLMAVESIQAANSVPDVRNMPVCVIEDSSNGNQACIRTSERQTIVNYPNGTYLTIPNK